MTARRAIQAGDVLFRDPNGVQEMPAHDVIVHHSANGATTMIFVVNRAMEDGTVEAIVTARITMPDAAAHNAVTSLTESLGPQPKNATTPASAPH